MTLDHQALDAHITGNHGEDSVPPDPTGEDWQQACFEQLLAVDNPHERAALSRLYARMTGQTRAEVRNDVDAARTIANLPSPTVGLTVCACGYGCQLPPEPGGNGYCTTCKHGH